MPFRDTPIQRKLMLVTGLTSVVVMLLMGAAFFTQEFLSLRQVILRQLSTLGEVLAANSTAALAFDNEEDAQEILSDLKADRFVQSAALYDRNGRIFARYPQALSAGAFPAAPGANGYRFGESHLTGFQSVVQGDRRLGTLFLKFDTGTILNELLWNALRIAAALMAVVLLVAYLVSRALQRQISGPILALAGTARAISERGDYSVRASKHGRDELGLLTDAFNQMLDQIHSLNRDLEQRVVERTAQLQAANKELEAFSYSVSHDLRAPLRHIEGFAQLLGARLDGSLDETARRYLTTVMGSAKRLGTLIDELLVFSKMGRTELRRSDVDTRAMIDEIVRELQIDIQSRRIDWQIGELPAVRADPVMLRQVWSNLIGNAVKYSRKREIAVIEISHRLERAEGHVFTVRDNGAGFEMEYAAKLFGVFQRLHTTKEFEGTGIGLANVRRIVDRHGGRTWAEGKPNEGASFYFSLPAAGSSLPLPP